MIQTGSHRDFELMNLNTIFPNVQMITLRQEIRRCTDCDFVLPTEINDQNRKELSRQAHECMRLGRLSFSGFARLTKLKSNQENTSLDTGKYVLTFTRENLGRNPFIEKEEAANADN